MSSSFQSMATSDRCPARRRPSAPAAPHGLPHHVGPRRRGGGAGGACRYPGTRMTERDDVETGRAAVNGLDLYYEIRGSGEPLILLHGGVAGIVMFGPNLQALSA